MIAQKESALTSAKVKAQNTLGNAQTPHTTGGVKACPDELIDRDPVVWLKSRPNRKRVQDMLHQIAGEL